MKNTIGNSFTLTLFGESHGKAIGAVLDGVPSGVAVDEDFIAAQMEKRKGIEEISTKRREADEVQILSGVFNGMTTGTPVCFMIENRDVKSSDYSDVVRLARPGHADYSAHMRYSGFNDYRGGGHTSGRLTAAIVAAGAFANSMLRSRGIRISTHISSLSEINDRDFDFSAGDADLLETLQLPVLCSEAREKILEKIRKTQAEGDSVGGTLSTVVTGMPAGVGEPWFDSVEGMLAHALFSIPGIKGVEFGAGFDFASLKGSEANDEFTVKNERLTTVTNNNGGINGGITNGMPLEFSVAVKPTPTIYKKQNTVDFISKENAVLEPKGRHDCAIIHRVAPVVDSITAVILCDLLITRFGTQFFGK